MKHKARSQKQIFHQERKFLMKGRIAAMRGALTSLTHSKYLTSIEHSFIKSALSYIESIYQDFDAQTEILEDE